MAVQWGLLGNGGNGLEALQAFGLAQQQRAAQEQAQLKAQQQQQEIQSRRVAASQYGAGDYRGATQTAIASGDNDLAKFFGGLDAAGVKEAQGHAEVIGRVAQALSGVPEASRSAELQRYLPMLAQQGVTPDQLTGADLSDAGLSRYVAFSQSVTDQIAAARPAYQVVPEGGMLVNTRDPQAVRSFSSAPQGGSNLQAQADAAIAAGANPEQVYARLRQMQGGAPSQGGASFSR